MDNISEEFIQSISWRDEVGENIKGGRYERH